MIQKLLSFSLPLIIAYVLGSIPHSYYAGKLKGIDIREHGSGNVGATNALRVLGVKIGLVVFILDILKGFAAVMVAKYLFNQTGIVLLLTGVFAIIGHIFTFLLKFKGGKGVATATGVFLALTPIPLGIAFLWFLIIVSITRFVSLGSITASWVLLITELVINIKNGFQEIDLLIMAALIALFITVKHKANIQRLLSGTENKISFKKK